MEPDPSLRVALGFALFAATHLGLAWLPVRGWLVGRLGRWGFVAFFSVVAWLTFGVAMASYATHAQEGSAGLALGAHPTARFFLIAAIALGSALMMGSFAGYARSPYGMAGERVREPRGLERVTRHAFFVGFALSTAAHALLATRRVGAVAMTCLAGFALVGAALQDRKLLSLRGEPYAAYLAATSTLPFAAIAAGRQRLVWRELPWAMLLLGVVLAWLLRAVHAHLFDHSGAYVIAAFVLGPLAILLGELRRDRRHGRALTASAARSEP
jgi:uncharacterized membrane protein